MIKGEEKPVAFMSRHLTKTEGKWGELEQNVALVSWGLRKARRYTSVAPKITVRLAEEADVACVVDKFAHLKLQALLVDLTLYHVEWSVGRNDWAIGGDVAAAQPPLNDDEEVTAPVMKHAEVEVRRKAGRSFMLEDTHSARGHLIVQFDGGSTNR